MLTSWSRYSVLMTTLLLGNTDCGFLASFVISFGCMISQHRNSCGGVAKIVLGPSVVSNFTIPCMVDHIAPNLNKVVRPSMMLCSVWCHMMTKSMRAIFRLTLS